MKKNLTYLMLTSLLATAACKKDNEPEPNLIIGKWELDDITVSDPPSGHSFRLLNTTPESTISQEESYEIEFEDDFTYERKLKGARVLSNNKPATVDIIDKGEWEEKDNDLDLDQDESTIDGLPTRFTVISKDRRSLVLETKDTWLAWGPDLVNSPQGLDTVSSRAGIDTLIDRGYLKLVEATFTMEFDRD